MYRDRNQTVPDIANAACEIKRMSSVDESLEYLRIAVTNLEDMLTGLSNRLSPVLNSTSVPSPVHDKTPAFGVPLADAIQQATNRIGNLSSVVRDLHDRLGV